MVADLGAAGHDARDAGRIAHDLRAVDDQLAEAQALVEFLLTQRAIMGSDAVGVMQVVTDEVKHRAKRVPTLALRYRKVL
jgi:hypothetical protein